MQYLFCIFSISVNGMTKKLTNEFLNDFPNAYFTKKYHNFNLLLVASARCLSLSNLHGVKRTQYDKRGSSYFLNF